MFGLLQGDHKNQEKNLKINLTLKLIFDLVITAGPAGFVKIITILSRKYSNSFMSWLLQLSYVHIRYYVHNICKDHLYEHVPGEW